MNLNELPRDKHYRYIEIAYAAALLSPGIQGRFRLGAVLVKNKQIIAVKHNLMKTHPLLIKFYKFPFQHAESNAIISAGLDNCTDSILYVLRILKNKSLALARPCSSCLNLIERAGVKCVFYTTQEGYLKL